MKDAEATGAGADQPDPEDRLVAVLDRYWDALRAGEVGDSQTWLCQHPAGVEGLPDLQLLTALNEARELVREDSTSPNKPIAADPSMPGALATGAMVGECRIERLLGRGGLGEVYLAHHRLLNRKVAVKVLLARHAADADAVQRFQKAIQIQAQIKAHANLAAAIDAQEHHGRLYLIMEYAPGVDLRTLVRQAGKPLPVLQACDIIRQAAVGLERIRQDGIVHRDIKPSNLMLTPEGVVKILDLGLARLEVRDTSGTDDSPTQSGALLGTADYIAPEQALDSHRATIRSDIYSLGCTFYFLLTGRPPFQDASLTEKLLRHQQAEPPAVARLRPDVPETLGRILCSMMAKRPEDRYQTPADVVTALDCFAQGKPASEMARPARRKRRLAVAAAVLVVALGLLGSFYGPAFFRSPDTEQKNDDNRDAERAGQSPLDALDPKAIPEAERFAWQPKELVAVIGEHRQRNWGSVRALSLPPNGQQVASYNSCGEIGLWEIPSGKALWHASKLDGRFFHPDGKHMLSRHKHVWDVSGGQPAIAGEIPTIDHEYLCSSRDGKLVLTWSQNRTDTVLLDCSNPTRIREVGRIEDAGRAAVSPDGRLIAVASGMSEQAPIRILEWDGKETRFRLELPGKGKPCYNGIGSPYFCFATDGRLGVCNDDGIFRLWDVNATEPKVVATTPKVDAQWPVFSPDNKRVALANEAYIQFWRIDGNRLEKTSMLSIFNVPIGQTHFESAAFLPNGNNVATGHLGGAVRFWDITETEPREINPIVPGVSERFEVSSDGKRLIALLENNRLTRYAFGGAAPQPQPFAGEFRGAPHYVQIASDTSVIRLGEFNSGKLYSLHDEPAELMPASDFVKFSDDGALALMATKDGKMMSLWSLTGKRDQLTDWVERPSESSHLIAPNRRHILQHDKRTISLWRHADKKLTKMSEVKLAQSFGSMTFAPDGNTVAVFGHGDAALLYAVRDDKLVPMPPGSYVGGPGESCFSPDGKQLATCGVGFVRVYDYPTAKLRHEWKFPGIVQRVLYAPDGRHLLVSGYNGVLYILRLAPPGISAIDEH